MEEIYRDSVNKAVTLDITGAIINSVRFVRNGETVGAVSNSSPALIPYAITHIDGEFSVEWTYTIGGEQYTRANDYKVVTPMFDKAGLINFNDQFTQLSDNQVVILERMVRQVIETHTGQTFGYEKGKITVYGNGDNLLRTSKRVISINRLGSNFWNDPFDENLVERFRPYGDGFSIGFVNLNGLERDNTTLLANGVIRDPYANLGFGTFQRGSAYVVDGEFGWRSVPTDITDAAYLLAELFSCNEATWRDRYVKAIRAADWRYDVDSRAFTGTGSVTVDNILAKYTVNTMAII